MEYALSPPQLYKFDPLQVILHVSNSSACLTLETLLDYKFTAKGEKLIKIIKKESTLSISLKIL